MAVAAAAAVAVPGVAVAEYPEKPITIIVSASVGGSVDGLARALAPYWEKELGQSVVVENKEGAGGITGVRYFLEQPDDGYSVWVGTEGHFSSTVEKTGTVKPSDLAVINMQQFTPTTWFVLETSRFKSLEDVIKEAKEKPDTVTYGSPPTGNAVITGGFVEKEWGLDLRYVPQSGGAETDTALLGGHIDIKIGTAGDINELEGIRALAVASSERLKFLPDTPTFNEIGAKEGFAQMPNIGTGRLVAVHATVKEKHPEIFKKLADTYAAAFKNPEFQANLESSGQALSTSFNTPEDATAKFVDLINVSVESKAKYKVE
jgi:tripartite-type tricarboxylate transporter receptor subunit TctC